MPGDCIMYMLQYLHFKSLDFAASIARRSVIGVQLYMCLNKKYLNTKNEYLISFLNILILFKAIDTISILFDTCDTFLKRLGLLMTKCAQWNPDMRTSKIQIGCPDIKSCTYNSIFGFFKFRISKHPNVYQVSSYRIMYSICSISGEKRLDR